jgi:hypothetical protein
MNATMVASGTKAGPPVVSSIQEVPLAKIRESKTNPRRFFDEAKLAELRDPSARLSPQSFRAELFRYLLTTYKLT